MSAKVIVGLVLTAFLLSLLPLALIARSRASKSTGRPIHLVMDMDKQPRFNPQANNIMFSDGRAMRPQVPGTVAREDMEFKKETLTVSVGIPKVVGSKHLVLDGEKQPKMEGENNAMFAGGKDEHDRTIAVNSPEELAALVYGRVRPAGMSDDAFNKIAPPNDKELVSGSQTFYVDKFPGSLEPTSELMARGQERFNIYCLPCHGATGFGDGMVQRQAMKLQATNATAVSLWAAPANLTDEKFRKQPLGRIYNTITNGWANMPAYDKQISIPDRWAIVFYVKALQDSQGVATPK